jgi:type I restriction enzyme S subunit
MTQLPDGWTSAELTELVEPIREQSRVEVAKTYELWSIPSFSDGTPEIVKGSAIGSSKLKVKSSDVLVSKINPRINRVWKVLDSNFEQLASPEWLVARIKDSAVLDNQYLVYYLSSPEFREWISGAASSVTGSHSRAKANEILQRRIPVPPIDEQHKIVELLEDHLSRLDAALADVKQAKIKAAQFRRSLLEAGLQGCFNHGIKDSKTRLPTSWKIKTLAEVADWTSGGTPSSKDSSLYGGDIPWIVIGDLTESLVTETEKTINKRGLESSSTKLMPVGTVMVAMYGASIGRTGVMGKEMTTNQAIACGIPKNNVILGRYLLYFLQSQKQEFIYAGKGGAQPNISQGVVKAWKIPLPPIAEQQLIIDEIDNQLVRLSKTNESTELLIRESASLRRSLLQAAFTGQLTKEVGNV